MRIFLKIGFLFFAIVIGISSNAQSNDSLWTLSKCIDYAMQKNISIQQKALSNETNRIDVEQTKAMRFPSLSASVSQNFGWNRDLVNNSYGSYSESNGTNYGVNSSVKLYNGFKTTYNIKQSELSYQAGSYDVDALKESISLSLLDAYLQVLYSEELVKNAKKQIESTTQQLNLSEVRLRIGSISRSDYLQVKSELASENLTLANAQNQLALNSVTLMQLMDYPLTDSFRIVHPDMVINEALSLNLNSDSVFNQASAIKPQVKSAELNKQIAGLGIAVAKAGYQPTLSLNGALSSNYNSGFDFAYGYQVKNKINPTIGLTLSIPIYQNKLLSSNVAIAKINSANAELSAMNVKNQLRKAIEQVCVNVQSAFVKYQASIEKFNSIQESFNVAQEKYNQGLLSSVDFLIQKTNLITAESDLLQSKYNLVFSQKILDFYKGIPLSL